MHHTHITLIHIRTTVFGIVAINNFSYQCNNNNKNMPSLLSQIISKQSCTHGRLQINVYQRNMVLYHNVVIISCTLRILLIMFIAQIYRLIGKLNEDDNYNKWLPKCVTWTHPRRQHWFTATRNRLRADQIWTYLLIEMINFVVVCVELHNGLCYQHD